MDNYQNISWAVSDMTPLELKTSKDMTPEQLERARADALLWAGNGLATWKHDRCACGELYITPVPDCRNYREHELAAERLARESVGELVEVG